MEMTTKFKVFAKAPRDIKDRCVLTADFIKARDTARCLKNFGWDARIEKA